MFFCRGIDCFQTNSCCNISPLFFQKKSIFNWTSGNNIAISALNKVMVAMHNCERPRKLCVTAFLR